MNFQIKWVNRKDINFSQVIPRLQECVESRHFTNFGKFVGQLETRLAHDLKLSADKRVVAVCNGANGLSALVGALCSYHGKRLRFAVQSFTFPCSAQTVLQDSLIVDFEDTADCQISLTQLQDSAVIDTYDGVIITNPFGNSVEIQKYVDFCQKHGKILLFDNAAAPFTMYGDSNISNYGDGAIISLHHTKPIGFGEGGAVIIDSKYYECLKRIICFGYSATDKYNYDKYASNYKMSEINAIYALMWLDSFSKIVDTHVKLYEYFCVQLSERAVPSKGVRLFPHHSGGSKQSSPFLSCLPVIFDREMTQDDLKIFFDAGIEVKKYYYPLDHQCPNAVDVFKHIVCFPLNLDMTTADIDKIIKLLIECC